MGTAGRNHPGVCDRRCAHLSNGEVRDGTRKSMYSRCGRRNSGGDWPGAGFEGMGSDSHAIARESIGMKDPAVTFEPDRRRLLGLAYRMLGSVSEAEDLSVSRQILVVVVVRNARTSDTVSRSMACQRGYASWTALGLPRHRLRPCMSRLVDAEFASGRQRQMRQQAPPFILDRPARDVAPLQVGEKTPDVIGH